LTVEALNGFLYQVSFSKISISLFIFFSLLIYFSRSCCSFEFLLSCSLSHLIFYCVQFSIFLYVFFWV
jgi:hypothetical protein